MSPNANVRTMSERHISMRVRPAASTVVPSVDSVISLSAYDERVGPAVPGARLDAAHLPAATRVGIDATARSYTHVTAQRSRSRVKLPALFAGLRIAADHLVPVAGHNGAGRDHRSGGLRARRRPQLT